MASPTSSYAATMGLSEEEANAIAQDQAQQQQQQQAQQQAMQQAAAAAPAGNCQYSEYAAESVTKIEVFEGMRVMVDKHANANCWTSQSFTLGRPSRMQPEAGSVTLGWNYATEDFMARTTYDPAGGVSVMTTKAITPNTTFKGQASVGSDCATERTFSGEIIHKGSDYWATGKYVSSSAGPGQIGVSYSQAITDNLAMGGEGLHITDQLSYLSLGYRYVGGNFISTGSLMKTTTGHTRFSTNYFQRMMGRIDLGAELEYDLASGESGVSLGYQFAVLRGVARGAVDIASGKVTGQVEQRIPGMSTCNVVISGALDHKQNDYSFGLGLQIAS